MKLPTEILAEIKDQKPQLLSYLLALKPTPALIRSAREGLLPLSFAQQRLWFLSQLQPDSALYNLPVAVRLSGHLDSEALQQALTAVVERHEALRTTFPVVQGQAHQHIHPAQVCALPLIDLTSWPEDERLARSQVLVRQEAAQPFDLANGPLLRTQLLKLDDQQHILLLTMHHIVSDAWSAGVLTQELSQLYADFSQGRASSLVPLEIQYADYALWQREHLQGARLDEQLTYWKQTLDAAPALLELPTDRPRPAVQSYRGHTVACEIDAALTARIKALGQQHGTTLFMTLLASYGVLLQRYSHQHDLVIGSPIANRNHPGIQPLIGFFVNTLALRLRIDGQQAFTDLLAQVREHTLNAYAHQDLPFEQLIEELKPVRSLAYSPLFQVMFAVHNAPAGELMADGLTFQGVEAPATLAKFDLSLGVTEVNGCLQATFEYSTDLFDQARIERMAHHWLAMLEQLTQQPDTALRELHLLPAKDYRQIVHDWNATDVQRQPAQCVHHLFEAQAARTPDAVALVYQDQQVSYRALNRQANQLAHYLILQGVQCDELVGVFMERSVQMIVALLGILKAGAAYTPLDPDYPGPRIAYMLDDAGVKRVLTQHSLLEQLPGDYATLCLDSQAERFKACPTSNPVTGVTPTNLAYCIYTSGSTGRPKGVAVAHGALAMHCQTIGARYQLTAHDREFHFLSISFDGAHERWITPLFFGACVVLKEQALWGAKQTYETLLAQGITVAAFPPSYLQQLADWSAQQGRAPTVNTYCFAGEAFGRDTLHHIIKHLSPKWIINGYGPTETVITPTIWRADAQSADFSGGYAPIGNGVGERELYVLDQDYNVVPIGVSGELYIGGEGLARGYLNASLFTAERFIPNPFCQQGTRLYRTGDLVRWRDDGQLEYLGRLDHQIKLRGFRIELAEIEAALRNQPQVDEVVVLVREDVPGIKQLVAYVVGDSAQVLNLQAALRQQLPGYMVPSQFVFLQALPLLPNGKTDRQALPAPQASREHLEDRYVAARNETEALLVALYEEVLKREQVGIHDSFFELGGHSLLAMQLIARLHEELNIDLPVRAVFEMPSIEPLADHVRQLSGSILPALTRMPREGLLPLSFSQQRLWFLSQLQPDSALYNLPVAVRLVGRLDPAALQHALTAVVERHEALRTTFPVVQGQAHQHIHPAQVCALPLIDLTSWPEDERLARSQVLVRQEAAQPFDLANGPLLRTQLLKLDDQQHILLLTMHHIVSDAWSAGVLTQELSQLYADFSQGRASSLVPLEIQYADYALWQREHLQGARLDEQLTYWKQTLDAAPALLELPTDRPRPAVQSYRGHTVACEIDAALTARIKALGQQHGTTLFMTLLASYGVLLQRYSHQHDLVIGSPIANRNHPGIQPLIGFFVNTLALRLRIDGQQAFTDLLAQVREHTLNAYAHQDLPFEQLIEELKPVRSLAYSPLFQVMFAVHNAPAGELMADGLTFQGVEAPATLAKFDLSLGVTEVNGCLQATFEYSTDLFDQARIERMAHHWLAMLEQLTQQPDTALRELHLLPAKDYRQIVHDWNATDVQRQPAQCVHHLFEAQAARTPDAVALVYQDQQVSYRALNRQANQLAHYLILQGVQCDELVGVFMERSVQMIVALLGILKAGAAYTPLDPDYPGPRIAYMLDDAGVKRVLTQHSLLEQLPGDYATLCLDSQAERFKACPTSNPVTGVTPTNLAYCIYTSGSTGRPKGVAVAHGALAMHCQTIGARYQLTAHDREFHFLSISFDGAHERWITPLFFGACVVLKEQALWGAKQTYETLLAQGITVAAFPPSYLQQLADWSAQQGRAPTVNTYCFAGEAFGRDTLHHIIKHLSPKWIINGYGPTETVITPTIWRADAQSADFSGGYAPIGNGVGERELYVLDQDYNVVPIGVSGELYIGGEGLARGYLNASLFTAERFIPNPFCQQGTRLYRTGDLVRWRDDGQLEYLGRLDHQIKLRGFRIELAEIEAALRNQPQVDEVVVLVREDVPGIKQLVAYVVGDSAQVLNLQAALRQQLPGYMVPSQFVFLQALPLLPNGKTDRQALPAPQASREHLEDRYVAARNETEALLVALYEEVLKREQVGIHDSFFELGGHSLLAMQLIARLHEELNIDLPVRAVFEMPSIEPLADHVRQLSGSILPALTRMPREGLLPLSFSQQRLWFLSQLQPDSALYNLPVAVRLVGRLDPAALQHALTAVVERHEALRTTFPVVQGQAHQHIHPAQVCALPLIDLTSWPEDERLARSQVLVRQEAAQPFDLANGPLLRTQLLKLDDQQHILLLTMHHIVSDAWSAGVLTQELSQLYADFSQGRASSLVPLEIQYADYALWQREHLQGARLDEQLTYWKQTLDAAPALLELPTDRPRPAVQSYRGHTVACEIDAALTARIKALGQQHGTTLFMTLLASYGVLLQRYSHQHDLVIGSPIANRNHPGIQPLIGFFVNTLALRLRIDGQQAFTDLLAQVREHTLNAYAHQDLPFEQLIEELKPVRSLAYSPLFQVMFAVHNAPAGELMADGLTFQGVEAPATLAKFDLSLGVTEVNGCLQATFEYSTDLFDQARIERMAHHWLAMLEQLTQQPDTALRELHLLPAKDYRQIVHDWNATDVQRQPAQCVHHLFEAQAARTPDAVALVYQDQQVSYRALNRQANQLAHYLILQGVQCDELVGVFMERSVQMIVALLGILKAGAAYTPLDPDYPGSRITYMLDDAGVKRVLTQHSLLEQLPGDYATLCLDSQAERFKACPSTNPVTGVTPANLAYCIYTSGSTGRPKGVANPHTGVVNRLMWMQEECNFDTTDVFLQKTGFGFDVSVWEFFVPLMVGARLVIAEPNMHKDLDYMNQIIREKQITVLHFVPSMLQAFLAGPADAHVLKKVFCSGEALPLRLQSQFFAAYPGVLLHNLYGPTEAAIEVSYWQCQLDPSKTSVPMGSPIANIQLYALDHDLNVVPIGANGELYIGGIAVARGYNKASAMSAERFVPNPFCQQGTRLYRTGDQVRWGDDGQLEYIGRLDHQVKLRGFRIELTEIEARLRSQAQVDDAVVVVREDVPGIQQLVAYVASRSTPMSDLQAALRQQLPAYMIPNHFVTLEKLPLNPSGKVDRQALPAPILDRRDQEAQYIAARDETEALLISLYEEILEREHVGVHDSFFDLGGHSLLATKLVAKLRAHLGRAVPLVTLFESPTVEELAVRLRTNPPEDDRQ
ncbi:amino acid adenylation domain-containing protein [Pseudomonas khavaziana]|uniref:Amino acid adenylation domain-containing protein n=1 Tax=Pseudomonas khavaziana TaxID=2842351 RepID=A0ABZ2DHB5_9PSED